MANLTFTYTIDPITKEGETTSYNYKMQFASGKTSVGSTFTLALGENAVDQIDSLDNLAAVQASLCDVDAEVAQLMTTSVVLGDFSFAVDLGVMKVTLPNFPTFEVNFDLDAASALFALVSDVYSKTYNFVTTESVNILKSYVNRKFVEGSDIDQKTCAKYNNVFRKVFNSGLSAEFNKVFQDMLLEYGTFR